MSDIVIERSGGILRVELNRPAQKNAMTAGSTRASPIPLGRPLQTRQFVSYSGTARGMRFAPATTSEIFSRIRPGRANLRRPA